MAKLYVPVGDLKHGELVNGGMGRYCEVHQKIHGRLFICDTHPLNIKEEIKRADRRELSVASSVVLTVIFIILLLTKVFPN